MKKAILYSILFSIFFACQNQEKSTDIVEFYLGTYTNGDSEGIYKYKMDTLGKFTKIGLVAKTNNPSFLAKSADNRFLLAVDETNIEGTGFVKSFLIENDSLLDLNQSKSGGAHPCFVTINGKNQVLVANYTGGNVGFLKLQNDGLLSPLLDVQQHQGKGTTSRQEAPHAHSTWFHPNAKAIISLDLGTNQLWFSEISEDEKFLYLPQQKLTLKDGAGPRHLAFHPNASWIYVLNELNNTVSLIKKDKDDYKEVFSIPILPEDFKEYSVAAEIKVSSDGKFIYVSNRGHNSISCLKIGQSNGELELIANYHTKGKTPRNFSLTPNGKFLVVANQDTNNLISFSRNQETGELTFVDEIFAPTPVYVLF